MAKRKQLNSSIDTYFFGLQSPLPFYFALEDVVCLKKSANSAFGEFGGS